jgi:hypothetical protein
MITLRELATVDLSRTYARQMGGNKIRHYKVSYAACMLGNDPVELIKKHIAKEEGETEFEVIPYVNNSTVRVAQALMVLQDHPEIYNALTQLTCKSILLQRAIYPKVTLKQKVRNFFANLLNTVVDFLNRPLIKIQHWYYGIDVASYYNSDIAFDHEKEEEFQNLLAKVKLIPRVSLIEAYVRMQVTPCTYLSVGFEEGDEEKAVNALLDDLKYCHENGLILGNLTLPSTMLLADTVGSGKGSFVLFCFLFLDHDKIAEMNGVHTHELPQHPEKLLPLKTISSEGSLKYLDGLSPSQKYEIEAVILADRTDENFQVYHENYKENVPAVNAAADRMNEEMKKRGMK